MRRKSKKSLAQQIVGSKVVKLIKRWWKGLPKKMQYFLVGLVIALLLIIIIGTVINFYLASSSSYIKSSTCTLVVKAYHEKMSEYTFWQQFLLEYKHLIGLLVFLLGISWAFHGFQVRLLA